MTIVVKGKDADFDINFGDYRQSGTSHTLQFAVRNASGVIAVPTAGTVTVTVQSPGATEPLDVQQNQFDLTDQANWIQTLIGMHVQVMSFTLGALDAGKTLDVTISSSFGI